MTQQNNTQEIEPTRATPEANNSQSTESAAASDIQAQGQPSEEKEGFFKDYCSSHPDAAQCRVYDL